MNETEKAINDLNVAKHILCQPQMLTPEMCVRIGKAITSAIALLKEQEAKHDYEASIEMTEYCEHYEQTYNPEDGSM